MAGQKSHISFAPTKLTKEQVLKLANLGLKIRRLFIPVLAILLAVVAIYAALNLVHSHKSASAPVAQKQTPQPAPKPFSQPIPVQSPEPKPQPAAAVPPAVVPMTQPQVEIPIKADPEQEKILENAKLLDQIKAALADESDKISKFNSECGTMLANNTNRISGVSFFSRSALRQKNAQIGGELANLVNREESFLSAVHDNFSNIGATPTTTPDIILGKIKTQFVVYETLRQTIYLELGDLDASIASAQKKGDGSIFKFSVRPKN